MASSRRTGTNENVQTYGNGTRDFTSLTTWEVATDNNLTALQITEVLECYADSATFTDNVDISNAITNSIYFRIIRPAAGQFHDGTPNSGVAFSTTTLGAGSAIIYMLENYLQIQDIVFKDVSFGGGTTIGVRNRSTTEGVMAGCIFSNISGTGTNYAIYVQNANRVVNCLIQDITSTASSYGIRLNGSTMYLYNCTVLNNTTYGIFANVGNTILKNSDVNGNGTDLSAGTITQTTNNIGATPTYVNAGGLDFHIAAGDTVLRGNGTDLSADGIFAFDDDIDFDTRSAWDIGFDEFVAAPPAGGVGNLINGGLVNTGLVGGRLV